MVSCVGGDVGAVPNRRESYRAPLRERPVREKVMCSSTGTGSRYPAVYVREADHPRFARSLGSIRGAVSKSHLHE